MSLRGRGQSRQAGVTLLELLVAMVLLGMVTAMLYSVLRVGIGFSARGTEHIGRMAKEQNLLGLLRRQVASAWFDPRRGGVRITADPGILRMVTRQPLLHRDAGVVLAVYRVNEAEHTLYYQEKKDYYNVEYSMEYTPDFREMERLYVAEQPVSFSYSVERGGVTVRLGETEFIFFPKSLLPSSIPSFSNAEQ